MNDYHHVHPQETDKAGEYSFSFVPDAYPYAFWADVTTNSAKQEVVRNYKFSVPNPNIVSPDKLVTLNSTLNSSKEGYNFILSFDDKLTAGGMAMANIKVTSEKDPSNPVDNLEPILGAFAHMVGFSQDLESVIHIHPLGKEPKTAAARSNGNLDFHIMFPDKKGFYKLFLEVIIAGKYITVPFIIEIK